MAFAHQISNIINSSLPASSSLGTKMEDGNSPNSDGNSDCLSTYAMQIATSSVLPMVFKSAIELGVLNVLKAEGDSALLSSSEIASKLPASNNPEASSVLERILRLLASHSILVSSVRSSSGDGFPLRVYGLAPVSHYFIPNQDGVSLAPLLHTIQDSVTIDAWFHLRDAVLEGGLPFQRAHGMRAAEYVRKDSRFGGMFRNSMEDYNVLIMKKIMEVYKGFEGLTSLVDVGGGNGAVLRMITSKYPLLRGINFDLPHVIQQSYPGNENIGGDMFLSIPKGDAIFMKWILHNWDDESCLKLLKNCHQALPEEGKVIVVDMVIPEGGLDKSLFQFDLFRMSMNPDGKERTHLELQTLGEITGFSGVRVAAAAFNFSVVEFSKSTS